MRRSFNLYLTMCQRLAFLLLLIVVLLLLRGGRAAIIGTGSSSAEPLLSSWANAYIYSEDTETVTYSAVANVTTGLSRVTSGLADFAVTDGALAPSQLSAGLRQVPLIGSALVVAFNLPSLASTDTLVLDGATLAAIWVGNITSWDDAAILDLNPTLSGKLPTAQIALSFSSGDAITQLFMDALSTFSPEFNATLRAAGGQFAGIGLSSAVERSNTTTRLAYTKASDNSMTYADSGSFTALASNTLAYASMRNAANATVRVSATTVQSAMEDYRAAVLAGQTTLLFDGPGAQSYPMSFLHYLSTNTSRLTLDCYAIEQYLAFLSWTQVNSGATNAATSGGYVQLINGFRKVMVDALGDVTCNGDKALSKAFLIGTGSPGATYLRWAVNYNDDNVQLEYFYQTSLLGITSMMAGDVDFGTTISYPTAAQQALMPYVLALPIVVGGVGPVYNIPDIVTDTQLVLDFQTISDIYLNKIKKWNHENITKLNPSLAMPDQNITIVYENATSSPTYLITSALSQTVPEFAARIGPTTRIDFPVIHEEPERTLAVAASDVVGPMQSHPYTLGYWTNYDVLNVRTVRAAAMVNIKGNVVSPGPDSFLSALNDFADRPEITTLFLGPGEGSWPLATYNFLLINSRTMPVCQKAHALVDWLYWTQSSTEGLQLANGMGVTVAGQSEVVMKRLLNSFANITCDGVHSFSLYGCVNNGTMCSNNGNCSSSSVCQCDSGWEGQYCQALKGASSDNLSVILGATLGAVIPAIVLLLLFLICVIIILVVRMERKARMKDDWEIDADELEMGEQLGAGGYGTVYRAKWRGTEVAVKMMPSDQITREMERNFKEEVRVMTALRHPNVVLFMAASTKVEKMCIVMEFMALGSLFDLLHNELIPELPYALKIKMAYHAAKGMHFLHSSGIVHRDLKSLNLLLDNKWNVKVSDFGLTKFRDDLKKGAAGGQSQIQGSVQWMAPEVLNETLDVDYILADVYAFVAVAVIRDRLRPPLPEGDDAMPAEYAELVTSCWHSDPAIRPTFLESMTRLSGISGDVLGTSISHTKSSSSASSYHLGINSGSMSYGSASTHSSNSDHDSSASSSKNLDAVAPSGATRAPEGEVVIVFSDITRAASLWEFNAEAMRDATLLHNELVRRLVKKHGGYEVVFLRDRNSGEGSFCLAFGEINAALNWCSDTQRELLGVEWPESLLEHPGAAEEWGDTDDRVLFKGLRVRMGVHVGTPKMVRDPMTRRVEYIGPVVNAAARITALAHGGQVLISQAAHDQLSHSEPSDDQQRDDAKPRKGKKSKRKLLALGKFEMPDSPRGATLYEVKTEGLTARFFGGVTADAASGDRSTSSGTSKGKSVGDAALESAVGEGMMFKEDNFLTSANLCRWVIDFSEVALGRQVGMGSYGVVFKGKWKGVEVAVKRFIKQKLDERRMLEFRAEMAFLSELHHPNIVLFIGACVKQPNLCIVTEFVKQGALKEILANNAIKLPWRQRLSLIRSAAVGINYLHSLHPVIVHRDLKPSNLLVDENWNVKVADFGFARIKEENATMTRCGTPSWTAPEVIRGEKYSEKADVYSFGIIMWQVVTRKEPFGGRNFMGVTLDVLEGKRPQVPSDCEKPLKKLMKRCWHATASKRPSMEDVVSFFDGHLGDNEGLDTVGHSSV